MFPRYYSFDDVSLVPNYSHFDSRKDVDTGINLDPYDFDIPIISANMDTITGSKMAIEIYHLGGLGILHRFMSIEDNVDAYIAVDGRLCGVSIGVGEQEKVRFEKLYEVGARIFCVDVAHAHSKLVGKMIKFVKTYPDTFVIAGNVGCHAGADYLASVGADAVKVGIAVGSVCTTRYKTGFYVPQLSAIMDCRRVGIPIIADGGINKPADVVKALAAGARMVMIGRLFAGTDEAASKTVYRGMASKEAQEDYLGSVADWRTDEGLTSYVLPRGPVKGVVKDIIGGLRSGLSYAGAHDIDELRRKATFVKVK